MITSRIAAGLEEQYGAEVSLASSLMKEAEVSVLHEIKEER
ncbi:hypothetical protein [Streptomyces sp. NPDC001068]